MAGWLDKFIYRLYRKGELRYLTIGSGKALGAATAYLFDPSDMCILAVGTAVPAGTAGYAKGALFLKTDAGAGVKGVYENIGTTAVCSFNLIGGIVPAEITLAEGSILVGNNAGVAAALAAETTGYILVGDGTTLTSVDPATNFSVTQGQLVVGGAGPAITGYSLAQSAIPYFDGTDIAGVPLIAGDVVTSDGTDVIAVNLTQSAVLYFDGTTLAALTVAAGDLVTSDGTDIAVAAIAQSQVPYYNGTTITGLALVAGDVLTSDGTDLVAVAIAQSAVLYYNGTTLAGLAMIAGDILTSDGTDLVVLNVTASSVLFFNTVSGELDVLAITQGSLLISDGTNLATVGVAANSVVVGDGTDVTTLTLIAGDLVAGSSAGASPVAVNLAAGDVLYFDGTDLNALALPPSSLLYTNTATTFLAALTLALGDLVTSDGTDVVAVNIPTGNVPIGSAAGIVALDGSTDGAILIGNGTTMTAQTLAGGVITLTNAGVTAFVAGAIVDADVNATAAIAGSKIHPFFTHQVGLYGTEQSDNTAGDTQMTVAQLTNLIFLRDTNGAPRNVTFPDADDLVAGITGAYVGMAFYITIHNNSGAANAIQMVAGVNCDLHPAAPATIAQNVSQTWLIVLENVTPAAEEYAAYLVSVT